MKWQRVRPKGIPKPKVKGMPGRGLTYERKVGKVLAAGWKEPDFVLWKGWWIWDGLRWHQPDFVLWGRGGVWVFECKLTQKDEDAVEQLGRYGRLVEKIAQASELLPTLGHLVRPVRRVQVTRIVRKAWFQTLRGRDVALEDFPVRGFGLWSLVL